MTGSGLPWFVNPAVAVFVVAVVVGGVLGLRADRRRRQGNAAYAAARGWEYAPDLPPLTELCTTQPFGVGTGRRATEVVRGTHRGREFAVFQYQYNSESTDPNGTSKTSTYAYQVALIEVAGGLPIVRMTHENAMSRVAEAFGGTDIEVESDAFNSRWRVWSWDSRAAHAILVPTMIDRLLKPDLKKVPFVFEPGLLMTYAFGDLRLDRFSPRVDLLCDVADLLPDFLAQDYPAN